MWAIVLGMRTTRWHVRTIEENPSAVLPAKRVVERYLDAIEDALAARDGP